MDHTFADYQSLLASYLNSPYLTNLEVAAAARLCFAVCQYDFIRHRQPNHHFAAIVAFTNELVDEVFAEMQVNEARPTLASLQRAIYILDTRFDFMQDPGLSRKHRAVIRSLLGKSKAA